MKYSDFGQRFKAGSGIVELMDDLGTALNENPDLIFMGGGNPGQIPEVEAFFQKELIKHAENPEWLHSCLGVYQSPQGEKSFRESLAKLLKDTQGWDIGPENIMITNGSQAAFFMLFNMLAGKTTTETGTEDRHILLPLVPEYIGYTDTGVEQNLFKSSRPAIHQLSDHRFKYQVDFESLEITEQTAAICVSRPTNPTGNMITDEELVQLNRLALDHDIPLIIDGAYGLPFPNLVFGKGQPFWNNNTILALSLSKLGLPGVRTGILVGPEEIISSMTHANTVTSLACGNIGPFLVRDTIADGKLLGLCNQFIKPFYQTKMQEALDCIDEELADLPYQVHEPEGAIFLWLWFPNLPITSEELYQRLKAKGMLVVAGHHFFPGMEEEWGHKQECIRVSYAQPFDKVEAGVKLLAEEVRKAYEEA